MSAPERYIVAVDGGGSTCRACIATVDGQVLGRATGKPANINTNFEVSRSNILATIAATYADAGLPDDRHAHDFAYLGLAGASIGDGASRLTDSLDFFRARVVTDRETTVQGALGEGDGTLVLVGTGSFFANRCRGTTRNIGGWGFRLCDDGSGAYLGLHLLRQTIKAHDGLIPHSPLTKRMLDQFGGSPAGLVAFAQTATPQQFGQLAPDLIAAFNDQDSVACDLIRGATNRLVNTLDILDAKTCGPIYFSGGLGAFYRSQLDTEYAALCQDPLGDALTGAVELAQIELVAGTS